MKINILGDFVSNESMQSVSVGESLSKQLKDGAFNICNFEGPIKGFGKPIQKSGPHLFQNEDTIDWLKTYNFKLVSLANNHTMDFGNEALKKTIESLKNIKVVGAGNWENAYKPQIFEINDKKIVFLSMTHCEFGTLTDEYDNDNKFGAAWINHAKINQTIQEIRPSADYIIALPHAGYEYLEQPLPEWRLRYKELIDLGCDAIIATHPHIIQPTEYYKGKPIFYSLGNFFFPTQQKKDKSWNYSLCVSIEISNTLIFSTSPIVFSNDQIDICSNDEFIEHHLKKISIDFKDDNRYMQYINNICDELLYRYYPRLKEGPKKRISERLLELKGLTIHPIDTAIENQLDLINNYRCESHRWLIARALKRKLKIQ